MNENIKNLACQAGIDFGNFDSVTIDKEQLVCFTQLLIKEVVYMLPSEARVGNGFNVFWTMDEHFAPPADSYDGY